MPPRKQTSEAKLKAKWLRMIKTSQKRLVKFSERLALREAAVRTQQTGIDHDWAAVRGYSKQLTQLKNVVIKSSPSNIKTASNAYLREIDKIHELQSKINVLPRSKGMRMRPHVQD